ncbi:MFS transporter [Aeromicrobium sp. P5_D10]
MLPRLILPSRSTSRSRCDDDRVRRAVAPLLAVTVAMVLADSAVVTLALPDILVNLDASVGQVAWVLIAYNLVLGLAAVPAAALYSRAQPHIFSATGIAVFAGASAWCAMADSIEILIIARCVQAIGGALALVGCLEQLVAEYGDRRGVATWVTAGVIGTAAGPVAGGLLTQAISWQAIFVVQVPFAALAVPAALAVRAAPMPETDRHRPAIRPNLTLALMSAALTAALFLLVLLLVEGWGRSPAAAAITVSVVPIAALAARPLARLFRPPAQIEVAVGCFLVAGGLLGLAIPPSANLAWSIAPQALVGLGLGLTVDQLTSQAMQMRLPRAHHAGWTIGARHVGVVVGLAILTPVFTADLRDAQEPAQQAITSLVLDAPLAPQDKIAVAQALGKELSNQQGQVPNLRPAFASLDLDPEERDAAKQLEHELNGQLERAATWAFRDSFLIGAGLALLALFTVVWPRRRETL